VKKIFSAKRYVIIVFLVASTALLATGCGPTAQVEGSPEAAGAAAHTCSITLPTTTAQGEELPPDVSSAGLYTMCLAIDRKSLSLTNITSGKKAFAFTVWVSGKGPTLTVPSRPGSTFSYLAEQWVKKVFPWWDKTSQHATVAPGQTVVASQFDGQPLQLSLRADLNATRASTMADKLRSELKQAKEKLGDQARESLADEIEKLLAPDGKAIYECVGLVRSALDEYRHPEPPSGFWDAFWKNYEKYEGYTACQEVGKALFSAETEGKKTWQEIMTEGAEGYSENMLAGLARMATEHTPLTT
jgi:hypothetical protein